ncbi:MAG TPA: hypothetical protein VF334_23750 [Polyangia bacterium]
MSRGAVIALGLSLSACGPHYWVRADAQPSAGGWIAARHDADGTVVAVRADDLRVEAARDDGARYVGRRVRRPNRFAAGLALVGVGIPLIGVALGFGIGAIGQNTRDGDINRDVAIAFGTLGGAATAVGVSLLSWAWPPRPVEEPIGAHAELVDAPPPVDSAAPVHP